MPNQEQAGHYHPQGFANQHQGPYQPFVSVPQRFIPRDFAYGNFSLPQTQGNYVAQGFQGNSAFLQNQYMNGGFSLHYDEAGNLIQPPPVNPYLAQLSDMNDMAQFYDLNNNNTGQFYGINNNTIQLSGIGGNFSQFSAFNNNISHFPHVNGMVSQFSNINNGVPQLTNPNGDVSQPSGFGPMNSNGYDSGAIIEQDEDAEGSIIKGEPTDDDFTGMGDVPVFVKPERNIENPATPDSPGIAPKDSDTQNVPDETVDPAQNVTRGKLELPRDTFDKYVHSRHIRAGYVQSLRPLCKIVKRKAQKIALLRARRAWMDEYYPKNDVERMVYLLVARVWGISYKEIKERGNIDKAVTTLRGNWRTMTKPASDRVRKPEWSDADDALIMMGHEAVTRSGPTRALWKKIGDWMAANGGRYPFGPAAIKKRWFKKMGDM